MTLKQVFIINKDLKMRAGKVAVQVAHGETLYMEQKFTGHSYGRMYDNYIEWIKDGLMKKIVLKATQEEMLLLIGIMENRQSVLNEDKRLKIWFDIVFDRGLTQVPADSMTCIVVEPLDEEMADHYFEHLKLL